MKLKIAPSKYCEHCGEKLRSALVGAEKHMMFYGDEPTIPLAPPYNQKTGKRQYVWHWWCPKKETYPWWQFWKIDQHDDFMGEDIIQISQGSNP